MTLKGYRIVHAEAEASHPSTFAYNGYATADLFLRSSTSVGRSPSSVAENERSRILLLKHGDDEHSVRSVGGPEQLRRGPVEHVVLRLQAVIEPMKGPLRRRCYIADSLPSLIRPTWSLTEARSA